jgi:hypothetical protein
VSTWFARCGFGVGEGASGNPTHHMQDMLKKGHTPTHTPSLPPSTTGTLHTDLSANGKGASVSYANHQSESRNVDVGCVLACAVKDAYRHVAPRPVPMDWLTSTFAFRDDRETD